MPSRIPLGRVNGVAVTGPPGFEPGFEAPEASVMSKLYYGPFHYCRNCLKEGRSCPDHGP